MVSHVVMRDIDSDTALFETLPEDEKGFEPWQFENAHPGYFVPSFGSLDLVRIAAFACTVGYSVDEFELRSLRYDLPLSDDTSSEVSEQLRSAICEEGAARALNRLAAHKPGTLVIGIVLTTPSQGVIRLARHGFTDATDNSEVVQLLAQAWKSIRFS